MSLTYDYFEYALDPSIESRLLENESVLWNTKSKLLALKGERIDGNQRGFLRLTNDQIISLRDIIISKNDLLSLPLYSFYLSFDFILAKAYLSRDDEVLYPLDNPIKKEKVLKIPYIPGSSWKGNLRKAFRYCKRKPNLEDPNSGIRLFGNEKQEESDFKQGRLFFFPSFFEKCGIEAINPHNRKSKTGRMPIHIECVPNDSESRFSILYVPFDIMGHNDLKQQVSKDSEIILVSIYTMMTITGFSAKATSGFGIAKDEVENGFFRMQNDPPIKFKKLSELKQEL